MLKIKENSIQKGFLQDIYKDRKSIGIILDKLDTSQIAFDAFMAVHQYMSNNSNVEIIFFSQDMSNPSAIPVGGLYHIVEMVGYRGNVISPSLEGIIDALRISTLKKIIWYIYDPHEFSNYDQEDIRNVLKSNKIIKVCRSEDHIMMIKSAFPDATIHPTAINNFDCKLFTNLIFKDKK